MNEKMTEFLRKVEWEGGLAEAMDYFEDDISDEVDDDTLCQLWTKAYKNLHVLESYIEALHLD